MENTGKSAYEGMGVCKIIGVYARDFFCSKMSEASKYALTSEKAIERYLVDSVTKAGGLCLKFASSNMTGYPDRIVLLPCGVSAWVEVKGYSGRITTKQTLRIQQLALLGQKVYVADSRESVDWLLEDMRRI